MNLLIFLIIIMISFIIVRIGAIAFELTGLEWSLAKFQSLSCFTGTGFTTRESELITGHPQRREIASTLMILGNAGLVTLIATFANTLRADVVMKEFTLPFFEWAIPASFLPWIKLMFVAGALFMLYKLFRNNTLTRKLSEYIRERLIKKNIIKVASFEELALVAEGYGVSSVDIGESSPIINSSIIESHLRDFDVTVLAIERDGKIIPNPTASRKILLNDRVVCFGKPANVKKALCGDKD
ncbi:MAG: TrkA C-terminal domain-containing protein [Candidatus Omnitrophota bacterium]